MLSFESPSIGNDVYTLHGRQIISRFLREKCGYPGGPGIGIRMQLETATEPVNAAIRAAVGDAQALDAKERHAVEPVAILGAGPGGLYAALILADLGIPFKIIEARDRVGGRLFTHKFDDKTGAPYNYFDVGAMRFPKISSMQRVFHLFHYDKLNENGLALSEKLKPYIMESPNSLLSYNGVTIKHSVWTEDKCSDLQDPFHSDAVILDTDPKDADAYIKARADAIVDDVIKPFATRILEDLEHGGRAGWDYLQTYNHYSVRAYMSTVYRPSAALRKCHQFIPDKPLSTDVVNWCETFRSSTGSFDRALTELVLGSVAFAWKPTDPCKPKEKPKTEWFYVDGGSFQIADTMHRYLESVRPEAFAFNQCVAAIKMVESGDRAPYVDITTDDEHTQSFSHVISTIPLPVLRTIDLSGAGLSPMQSNALRELNYGPSVKIGMQFRTAWWTDKAGLNIVGGQTFTDTPLRTVVYPSYGAGETTTLIASYCWTEDAERLAALVAHDEKRLEILVLRELATIHNVEVSFLRDQLIETFSWSWSLDPFTMGAFAFFGPGKFRSLYEALTSPAAKNHLHFAGEALSTRHAWVEGALDSAWRAVFSMLFNEPNYRQRYLPRFFERWGVNEEWVTPIPKKEPTVPRGDGDSGGSTGGFEWGDVSGALETSLLVHHMIASSL